MEEPGISYTTILRNINDIESQCSEMRDLKGDRNIE